MLPIMQTSLSRNRELFLLERHSSKRAQDDLQQAKSPHNNQRYSLIVNPTEIVDHLQLERKTCLFQYYTLRQMMQCLVYASENIWNLDIIAHMHHNYCLYLLSEYDPMSNLSNFELSHHHKRQNCTVCKYYTLPSIKKRRQKTCKLCTRIPAVDIDLNHIIS